VYFPFGISDLDFSLRASYAPPARDTTYLPHDQNLTEIAGFWRPSLDRRRYRKLARHRCARYLKTVFESEANFLWFTTILFKIADRFNVYRGNEVYISEIHLTI
jgi:hypothetical protein